MSSPLARLATRVAYGATQLPRMAFYAGHAYALQRLAAEARRREGEEPETPSPPRVGDNRAPIVSERKLYGDMAELLARDLANVEAGIYPLPADHDGSLPTLIRRSRLFFNDLPDVHQRRKARRHDEVLTEAVRGTRPDYYLQNFHFQSGGWLTDEFSRPLRHPGRGAVQGHRECDAPHGAAGIARGVPRPRPAHLAAH